MHQNLFYKVKALRTESLFFVWNMAKLLHNSWRGINDHGITAARGEGSTSKWVTVLTMNEKWRFSCIKSVEDEIQPAHSVSSDSSDQRELEETK